MLAHRTLILGMLGRAILLNFDWTIGTLVAEIALGISDAGSVNIPAEILTRQGLPPIFDLGDRLRALLDYCSRVAKSVTI